MTDKAPEGYRPCVGLALFNAEGLVFVGRPHGNRHRVGIQPVFDLPREHHRDCGSLRNDMPILASLGRDIRKVDRIEGLEQAHSGSNIILAAGKHIANSIDRRCCHRTRVGGVRFHE